MKLFDIIVYRLIWHKSCVWGSFDVKIKFQNTASLKPQWSVQILISLQWWCLKRTLWGTDRIQNRGEGGWVGGWGIGPNGGKREVVSGALHWPWEFMQNVYMACCPHCCDMAQQATGTSKGFIQFAIDVIPEKILLLKENIFNIIINRYENVPKMNSLF